MEQKKEISPLDTVSLEVWIETLKQVHGNLLAETAREQASRCVMEGNVYFAAMLRELANRVESGILPVRAVVANDS